jgi:hypothetical protein
MTIELTEDEARLVVSALRLAATGPTDAIAATIIDRMYAS